MPLLVLLVVSVFLSVDSFATALARSTVSTKVHLRKAIQMGLVFACSEVAMACIGWLLAVRFSAFITGVDHWISFILLTAIGGHMLFEGLHSQEDDTAKRAVNRLQQRLGHVAAMVGTSADSAAFGVSLAFLSVSRVQVYFVFGFLWSCVFVVTTFGALLGRQIGQQYGKWAERAGGLVLIGIGTYILLSHTLWAS